MPAKGTTAAAAVERPGVKCVGWQPTERIRVGIFGAEPPLPRAVAKLAAGVPWCTVVPCLDPPVDVYAPPPPIDVALVIQPPTEGRGIGGDSAPRKLVERIRTLQAWRIGVGVVTAVPGQAPAAAGVAELPYDVSSDRLCGTLSALAQLRPALLRMDHEVSRMRSLGDYLRRHFEELQRDLSLAARLQRDFLPRQFPDDPRVRFASLYRPCNWVSGDMFDVFRLGPSRVGMYVIDAMGHGVAAALMTMFIRNAMQLLVSRAAEEGAGRPGEVLARLNDALVAEQLPDAPFVTGWYGVVDLVEQTLSYANAGHPPALYVAPGGVVEELGAEGTILGVFGGQTFAERRARLAPGGRILLFTDGLEDALRGDGSQPLAARAAAAGRWGAEELVQQFAQAIDNAPGGLGPRMDDVTLVVCDLRGAAGPQAIM